MTSRCKSGQVVHGSADSDAVKGLGKPGAGERHARLCVQRRLARSAGDRPAGVTARRPVAWMAERRETKVLKPIDNRHRRSNWQCRGQRRPWSAACRSGSGPACGGGRHSRQWQQNALFSTGRSRTNGWQRSTIAGASQPYASRPVRELIMTDGGWPEIDMLTHNATSSIGFWVWRGLPSRYLR